MTEFTTLPDLAVRTLGGSVAAASDESFADKENLINPWAPGFSPETFGPMGQLYEGWETAGRRDGGHDWALIRLGLPGVVRGVVIDTAWFKGNYPPRASVEACAVDGYPSDLSGADWVEIVPESSLKGDTAHAFPVAVERLSTHVRLNMFPDGGIARLRVHGEVVPDPRLLAGLTVDLAALENHPTPHNCLSPGRPPNPPVGGDRPRRRAAGHDWAVVRLAAPGVVRLAEIDTANLKFNAPGSAALHGRDAAGAWHPLLPRTALLPDTRHRFRLTASPEVTHVRLDIHPDGGIARLRLLGDLTPDGARALDARWTALKH